MCILVFFCMCFWNRISSHADPVPMPILRRRYFCSFFIFDHFVPLWLFTFSVLMRVNHLLTGGLGQEVSLLLRSPPPVFAHLLGHRFFTFCENWEMTGWIFFELYRFLLSHFLTDFWSKVLIVWKFVKNRFFK